MDPAQAKLAFQVISERYDYRRSTAITTNRPFKDWTKVFPDALNAQVIAERLTERSEHFVLDGKGFRNRPAPDPTALTGENTALRSAAITSALTAAPSAPRPQGEEPPPHRRVGPWAPVMPLKVGPSVAGGDTSAESPAVVLG